MKFQRDFFKYSDVKILQSCSDSMTLSCVLHLGLIIVRLVTFRSKKQN